MYEHFMKNKDNLINFRKNAIKYIKNYDWNRIFHEALGEINE